MSRRLCIGVLGLTSGWKTILDQIGCWFEELHEVPEDSTSYSLLIINKSPSEKELHSIQLFISSGGAVLKTIKALDDYTPANKLTRIYNNDSPLFLTHLPYLDIYHQQSNDSLADLYDFENDFICSLKIAPDDQVTDRSYTRKRFFYKQGRHPDELVSKTSKHELTELVLSLIKELHFSQSLPFINKWHSPEVTPVFAFRIDSDYGDKTSIEKLYELGAQHEIPITWFLHVEAHEDWLSTFKDFEGQELALHGYEHGTSTSYEHVINNIELGLQKLIDEGIEPKGFCAPYGIWNSTLEEVLQKYSFEYTSEFTVGYDGLPFYLDSNSDTLPIQIPIHPICTGSLSRKRVCENEMTIYFEKVLESKLVRSFPVIFYHHPLQQGLAVWDTIFKKVNKLGLTKLSFLEYSGFWKERLLNKYEAYFDTSNQELSFSTESEGLIYQKSFDHNNFELISIDEASNIEILARESYQKLSHQPINELKELTSSTFQLLKTSILDWRNRKKL
ncbi:MAG: DUF2334 domain-containing protein [Balneola sp.]|nr:MAG: DUF2334 domain-containing protein [Balneola sp.]